jgi:hypothetical protein
VSASPGFDTAPPASTNSPPPLTMVFLATPPDLLCMGLFCKKQFRVPPPRSRSEPEHERADRGRRVTVEGAEIDASIYRELHFVR